MSVAQIFFQQVFWLHGLPNSNVGDRDAVVLISFLKELFCLQGVSFKFSSAYHPESDGQIEVVNRTVQMYLRCFTNGQPKEWLSWLPWAGYCYNTSYHNSIRMTPYDAVYGKPTSILSYIVGSASTDLVDQQLKTSDLIL